MREAFVSLIKAGGENEDLVLQLFKARKSRVWLLSVTDGDGGEEGEDEDGNRQLEIVKEPSVFKSMMINLL